MRYVRLILTTLAVLTIFASFSHAEEFAPLFPFALSTETRNNITNVATWPDDGSWKHAPAGKYGFIRVEDGKFVHDQGRFLVWGTNTCFSANFPEKEQAEKVAARLARFGFNCVRLHHMDSRDIWGGSNAKSQLTIDPEQLDKLDYFIFQLKRHGIYVNINLHVSRWMDERDGFTDKNLRPNYDKGLDNFYEPLIDVQKKYARELLTHVNPYTKTAYFEEPAVAMIEINNENSVVSQWAWGDKLLEMPDPYRADFQRQWNEFLRKKYKSTAEIWKAWNCIEQPVGEEILASGTNEPKRTETQKWNVQSDSETKYKKTGEGNSMRLEIEKKGKAVWIPQLIADNLKFEEGKLYTFSIRIRSDKPATLTFMARMSHDPWSSLGFHARIDVGPEWKTFEYTFQASATDDKARFDIGSFSPGVFEFADSSLRPGGFFGLKPDQKLEDGTVPLVSRNETRLPKEAVDDFCEFLFDIEEKYWVGFYRFLKDELGVRQPISGTQLRYGSTTVQAKLDYIDNHAYWNHPTFPGRPWDGNNWYIRNRALVDHVNTDIFPLLGTARVLGKPYTISEFDSPMPNQYAAEALPLLAAFGRFQDWDGIFHFAYAHGSQVFDAQKATSFFDMAGNTVKLAHQPACVAMFRRGDVAVGETLVAAPFAPEKELEIFKRDRGTQNFLFKGLGLDPRLTLLYRTALDVSGRGSETFPEFKIGDAAIIHSETDEITLSSGNTNNRCWVSSPNAQMLTGFLSYGGSSWGTDLRDVRLYGNKKTRLDWATISLVSVNGNGFDPGFDPERSDGKPIRILVTATGLMQNTDMKIEQLDDDKITFGNRWGKEPVLCEGIPFDVEFTKAKSLRCFPLDEQGNRREEIKSEGNRVKLGPENETIWYEIELN